MSTRIVTFLSDFGEEDHYVAAVKAQIIQADSDVRIVDISHRITPFDIAHAAYVIRNCFQQFPANSIHLLAIDPSNQSTIDAVVARIDGHIFICPDNGLVSLVSDNEPEEIFQVDSKPTSFLARDLLGPICRKVLEESDLSKVGKPTENYLKLVNRMPKVTKREIVGNVIRVDGYGNLITNIKKSDFDKIQELNGNVPYQVQFGREIYHKFHHHYADVEPGDCYVLFNGNGFLQVGINKGNAHQLLGLRLEAPVYIEFETK